MAEIRTDNVSFAGGELTSEMFGRIDDEKYKSGLALCQNFLVKPHGPVANRAGLAYVSEVKDSSKAVRVIPYIYSIDQNFCIEVNEGCFRFHTLGATLLYETPDAWVTSTDYTVGDLVSNSGTNYYCKVDHTSGTFATDLTSGYWYAEPSSLVYEVPHPYAESDLFDLHYVQQNDILTIVHPSYPPAELRRYGATDWRLVEINFAPVNEAPTGVSVAATSVTSGSTGTYKYVVTTCNSSAGGESLASSMVSCTNYYVLSEADFNTISWTANTDVEDPIYKVYKYQGGLYGYIGQTSDTSLVDNNIAADISMTPPIDYQPFDAGRVTSATVTAGGSSYVSPTVTVNSSTGSGAQIDATVSGGVITHLEVVRGGTDYASTDTITISAPDGEVAASGYFTLVEGDFRNDWEGDTITLNGTTWTFSKTAGTNVLTLPGGTWTGSPSFYGYVQTWVDTLNASTDTQTALCTYAFDESTGRLSVTYDTVGTVGNSYTLAASATNVTASGSTLTGGVSGTQATGTIAVSDVVDGYPGAVSYFEQRRGFAGTNNSPQNLWLTRSGTESDLRYSLPTRDDDSIEFRVAAREANTIRHLVPLSNLLLLTSAAEWRVTSLNSDAITPSSLSVRPQSYIGASNVQPVVINNNTVYAAARGGHLREMAYTWQASGYVTGDICLRCPHLFDGYTVTDLAYAKSPIPIIWATSSSGKAIGCTYVPEQKIGGMHQHKTSTLDGDSYFESVCVVPEGDEDAVYFVVRRVINGSTVRYIERMGDRASDDLADAFFVDCGYTHDCEGVETQTLTGIDWLEGETVNILVDGAVHPQKTVSGGSITLNYSTTGIIQLGLPIQGRVKTLPIAYQTQGYGQGRQKNVNEAFIRVDNSSGLRVGPSFDKLTLAKQRTTEAYGSPPDPMTREVALKITPTWADSGSIYIEQSDPLPMTIASVCLSVEVGG